MAWRGNGFHLLVCPVQPSVPEDVEPKDPDYLGDPLAGRFIIPEGIRPVLKEFRIEVRCLLLGPVGCPEQTAQLTCAQGRAWGGSWVWSSDVPWTLKQIPEMEVVSMREERSQQFNSQRCWESGLVPLVDSVSCEVRGW